MSPSARAGSSLGEIVNLMQMDSQRIDRFTRVAHLLWAAPIQLIVVCILLFDYIGWAAVVGVTSTALTVPIQSKIMRVLSRLRKQAVGISDQRIKLVNEVLQGVKAVKLYAWETPFSAEIEEKRDEELRNFRKTIWVNSIFTSVMHAIPVVITVITFSFYAGVFKNVLDPARVFTAFTLLNTLRGPLILYPGVINGLIDSNLGFSRIEKFLAGEDTEDYSRGGDDDTSLSDSNSEEPHIIMKNGSFKWCEPGPPLTDPNAVTTQRWNLFQWFKKSPPSADEDAEEKKSDTRSPPKPNILEGINVNMKTGKLTGLVGRVGSGKSSMVSAILGEMQKTAGYVSVGGSVAYVAQTAWIFNDTLQNNILFGKEMDEELYRKALKVSALGPDIDVLPAGDQTAIGEKGINLSGGQKQRVSIARAIYSDADVYIFDDPLSALDAHVSQKVFHQCLSNTGVLKDRLRLLITNQGHVLPHCDNIILLEEGHVRMQGTYDELVANAPSFQEIVNDQSKEDAKKKKEQAPVEAANPEKPYLSISISHNEEAIKAGKNLIQDEDRTVGNIKLRSYYKYAVACGGAILFSMLMAFWALVDALGIYTGYWLAFWTDSQTREIKSGISGRGMGFYIGIYFLLGIGYAILLCVRSVAYLILALRASRKLHNEALTSMMRAPMTFFDTTPIGRILSRFARDVAAVDRTLPQKFSESVANVMQLIGSYILIAYFLPPFLGAAVPITIGYWLLQRFFHRTSLEVKRLDNISKSPIYAHFSETLSGLRTIRAYNKRDTAIAKNREMIDINTRAYFTFISASRWFSLYLELLGTTLIFFTALFAVVAPGASSASEIGLSLSYVLQVTSILGLTIRSITNVESQMSSVERLQHFGKKLPQEADAIRSYDDLHDDERPNKDWPREGAIEIEDASLRYREGSNLVLKGVSAKIEAGQKVGIIGRTGSGKSTLMVALLRLVELVDGSIKVDDVDISNLGLDHIRKTITIIPQDPVLFSGTIRFNLDPFNLHNDSDLWDALDKSNMKHFVEEFDEGLDSFVSEYGENISAGQRQLICLTRALLRKSKILILESGVVVEFGTPYDLLQDENSKLSGFVRSLGREGANQFREIVRQAKCIGDKQEQES